MAQMFERDTAVFTEQYEAGAEPGVPAEAEAEAPAAEDEAQEG